MDAKPLHELNTDELSKEVKKRYNLFLISCVFVGFVIGVSIYAMVTNGFGLLTFLPLPFLPLVSAASKKYNQAKEELQKRDSVSAE